MTQETSVSYSQMTHCFRCFENQMVMTIKASLFSTLSTVASGHLVFFLEFFGVDHNLKVVGY